MFFKFGKDSKDLNYYMKAAILDFGFKRRWLAVHRWSTRGQKTYHLVDNPFFWKILISGVRKSCSKYDTTGVLIHVKSHHAEQMFYLSVSHCPVGKKGEILMWLNSQEKNIADSLKVVSWDSCIIMQDFIAVTYTSNLSVFIGKDPHLPVCFSSHRHCFFSGVNTNSDCKK